MTHGKSIRQVKQMWKPPIPIEAHYTQGENINTGEDVVLKLE